MPPKSRPSYSYQKVSPRNRELSARIDRLVADYSLAAVAGDLEARYDFEAAQVLSFIPLDNNKPLMSGELSKLFQISETTLCNLRPKGLGPEFQKVGGQYLYWPSAIRKWLENGAVGRYRADKPKTDSARKLRIMADMKAAEKAKK